MTSTNGSSTWKPALRIAVEPPEPLDDVRALLRDDDRRLRDDDEDEEGEDQQRDEAAGHERSLSGLRKIISRSTLDDPAPLAARDRRRVLVARRPHGAAQLGAPNRARGNVLERHARCRRRASRRPCPADRAASIAAAGCGRASSEPTEMAENSRSCSHDRACPVEHVEAGDRQRGDAEEDDVEAARRRHFEGDEDEADDQPMPPYHGRSDCSSKHELRRERRKAAKVGRTAGPNSQEIKR